MEVPPVQTDVNIGLESVNSSTEAQTTNPAEVNPATKEKPTTKLNQTNKPPKKITPNIDSKKPATTKISKIKKLKARKKYYVRIRTYIIVNGKKKYSDWSKKKSQKTK